MPGQCAAGSAVCARSCNDAARWKHAEWATQAVRTCRSSGVEEPKHFSLKRVFAEPVCVAEHDDGKPVVGKGSVFTGKPGPFALVDDLAMSVDAIDSETEPIAIRPIRAVVRRRKHHRQRAWADDPAAIERRIPLHEV